MNAVSIVSPLRLCSAWYLDDQHADDGSLSFRSSRPAGAKCRARYFRSAIRLLHTNRPNLPTHTFPLVLRSDSRPNILLEFLHYLYESAPEFEALSRPSGIRDSRVSLTVQSAGAEYTALQQK